MTDIVKASHGYHVGAVVVLVREGTHTGVVDHLYQHKGQDRILFRRDGDYMTTPCVHTELRLPTPGEMSNRPHPLATVNT